jgi:hypothetical protein
MSAHPDRTTFLRRSLVVGSALVILAGPLILIGHLAVAAAAVLVFTAVEVVGLARRREMAG